MTPGQRVGRNLFMARRSAGLSQVQLAERVSTYQSHISNLELGIKCPRLDTLVKLADALGVTAADLLSEVG